MENRTAWEYNNSDVYCVPDLARSYLNKFLKGLHLSEKDVVLDIASGSGKEADFLRRNFGCKVFETDLQGRQRTENTKYNFAISDIDAQPFPDSSFNLVHCKDAFIHIPYKDSLFQEVSRIMKATGKFLLTTQYKPDNLNYLPLYNKGGGLAKKVFFSEPNEYKDVEDYAKREFPKLVLSHPFFFLNEESIEALAVQLGLIVEDKSYWTPLNTEQNWSVDSRVVYKFKKR